MAKSTNQTTNQTQESVASHVIERPSLHDKNFELYITQYAKANDLPMRGDLWQAALAAAKRLDYTGDRDVQPNMKLIPSQPSFLQRILGRVRRTQQQIQLTELESIRAFLQLAPEAAAQQSQILWGPLRNGYGTWVIATLRPGGQQKGSRPTPPRLKNAPGWPLLSARRLLNGKALHVRGHLLHHQAGGAGVDFNLVSLTAAARGDFGANHANWVHRYLVEAQLLWAMHNMYGLSGTPTISEIYYEVVADYNRPAREESKELLQIAIAYREAAKLRKVKFAAEGSEIEPTHLDVMNWLAQNPPSAHLHDAMSAVYAEPGENWRDVHKRIVANQQLWQFEDQNVPKALQIRYSWLENGVLKGPYSETVSIVLPTSLAARFKPST